MAQDQRSAIEEQLLKIRIEAEEREAQRKAAKAGLTYINLGATPIQTDALKLIPEEKARNLRIIPFQLRKPDLALAIFDPEDIETKKLINDLEVEGFKVKIFIVSLEGLKHAWGQYKYVVKEAGPITGRIEIEKGRFDELHRKLTNLTAVKEEILNFDFKVFPVSQILEIILAGALANRGSDIHFEPEEDKIKIRFRIDGLLHDIVSEFPKTFYPYIISRIKLLSNLKINVQDKPQDGRFSIDLENQEIEIRVSINPSEFGETIVMRVLDPGMIRVQFEDLGLRKDDLEMTGLKLKEPNGMILNTGPTGSGKTTTLYGFLRQVFKPEIKIITIEDPIEYHLDGVEQTQVDPEADYTFVNGLRSIMRQDPDMILVGEIRDKETAEIAIQASLTGHLVFSTVHANRASGAIPRLIDLGVKPVSIGPALRLIIAQRLARRLCNHCRIPQAIDKALENKIKKFLEALPSRVDRRDYKEIKIFEAKGCPKCSGLGYKGRTGIFELIAIDKELEELINRNASEAAIYEFALKNGLVTMQQDGILKVISGLTTFEEVERATGPLSL